MRRHALLPVLYATATAAVPGCVPGTFQPFAAPGAPSLCHKCPLGKYASLPGVMFCTQCTKGRWTSGLAGTTACVRFGASERPLVGAPIRTMRPHKQQTDGIVPHALRIRNMVKRKVAWSENATSWPTPMQTMKPFELKNIRCRPPDTYRDNLECKACPNGQYTEQVDAHKCTPCQSNRTASDFGFGLSSKACTSPTSAPTPLNMLDRAGLNTDCGPGKFNRFDQCRDCKAGQYQDKVAKVDCKACPAGQASAKGQAGCSICPVGRFAKHSADCTKCPFSKFQSHTGKTQCEVCAAGELVSRSGASCAACPFGKVAAPDNHLEGSIRRGNLKRVFGLECVHCELGEFLNNGTKTCHTCPRGKFGDTAPPRLRCHDCPSSKYQSLVAKTSCRKCGQGRFSRTAAQACVGCPAGKYSPPNTNASECQLCPAGKYQSGAGEEVCLGRAPCASGKYVSGKDKAGNAAPPDLCSACPAGQYTRAAESRRCKKCPSGMFSADGQAHCQNCSPSVPGCPACPTGRFRKPGAASCSKCPKGKFQDAAGKYECATCTAGRFCPLSGMNFEGYCPVNKYSLSLSSQYMISCLACPTGQISEFGIGVCHRCAAGRYFHSAGKGSSCLKCPIGKYQPKKGTTACILKELSDAETQVQEAKLLYLSQGGLCRPPLVHIRNGKLIELTLKGGPHGSATYACSEGYSMVGPGKLTCTQSSATPPRLQWSGTRPVCNLDGGGW
jgi:hypothetical protein